MKKIPVCEPNLGSLERKYLIETFDSGWISSISPHVKEFEDAFCRFIGSKHAISTTSGTTALHLAVAALDIGEGDEVIIPTFTMVATCNAILYQRAKPVLVDADPETWCMDVEQLKEKITPKTKAIIPVHIYGHACDMKPIMDLAEDHDLYVIEDCAEAIGTEYKRQQVGTIGTCGTFSFYANKTITCGEGGIMITDGTYLAGKARILMNHGFTPGTHFLHHYIGFNFRMTALQAAIGLAQLERVYDFIEIKRRNAALYSSLLKDIHGITLPVEKEWCKNSYWMYGILVNEEEFGMNRDELQKYLEERGIETRIFFRCMHNQPIYKRMGLFKDETYPVAERLERDGLYLPSSTKLTPDEIKYICECIKEAVF